MKENMLLLVLVAGVAALAYASQRSTLKGETWIPAHEPVAYRWKPISW